ncbi:MAG: CRISPR-associated endoribonuclease Cas6 [Spirochaetota bacterium]
MRIKIKLYANNNVILPKSYNHIMQGFIYANLDRDFREYIHEGGFEHNKRKYKMFTFSKLRGKKEPNIIDGKIIFDRSINFVVSSLNADFIENLSRNIFKNRLRIGNNLLKFHSLELYDDDYLDKRIHKDKILIKLISPIVIYSTDENKHTVYYSPMDKEFKEQIHNNILNKYKAFYDREMESNDFNIEPADTEAKYKSVMEKYKNFFIKGYYGTFYLEGNPELVKVAYYSGLGSKNSQGFGCFNIIK